MTQNFTDINDLIKKTNKPNQVGRLTKEVEPISRSQEFSEIQEVVEHEPNKEVAGYVKVHKETIQLPPDLKKLGLQTPPTTSKFPGYQNVKLPISDDKVITGLNKPVNTSIRWLATLAMYLLRRAHLSLKIIGGKAVRIFKA